MKNIYDKNGRKYADVEVTSGAIGIEFDEETNEVQDLHFSIVIGLDELLKNEGYKSDEEQHFYYNNIENVLIVSINKLV